MHVVFLLGLLFLLSNRASAGLSFFDDKMEGLMANTAKPVGRGGMSVDANGTERPLAYWPVTC